MNWVIVTEIHMKCLKYFTVRYGKNPPIETRCPPLELILLPLGSPPRLQQFTEKSSGHKWINAKSTGNTTGWNSVPSCHTKQVHWPIPGGHSTLLGSSGCPHEGALVPVLQELGKQCGEAQVTCDHNTVWSAQRAFVTAASKTPRWTSSLSPPWQPSHIRAEKREWHGIPQIIPFSHILG